MIVGELLEAGVELALEALVGLGERTVGRMRSGDAGDGADD
ncbi:MAG: hypothetical protein V5A23_01665 [Halobacteriales archaeon]